MDARLDLAQRQIQFARDYVLRLLTDIPLERWFETPAECPTHIAWQVGHLAMAEYGLVLFRQRGRQTDDAELMSGGFRKRFSRGSVPSADANDYPRPESIQETLHAVHRQAMAELPEFAPEQLDDPLDMPYAAYPTKYGALLFCSHHEMLHAGQIGLIRRQLGYEPLG